MGSGFLLGFDLAYFEVSTEGSRATKGWQRANNHAVESGTRFATRMSKVQEYINSSDFRAKDGGGLDALAKSTHERCSRVSLLKGERLRT